MADQRPRLFLGNFDFEAALVSPSACASRDAIRRNSELAAAWLSIARPGDVIVTEHLPDEQFPQALERLNRKGVRFARASESFDDDCVVTPWGWERRVIGWADACGLPESSPPLHAIAIANCREFSFTSERDMECGLAGQAVCCTATEVADALSRLRRWLIKANFGASGRERISGSGLPTEEMQKWVEKRLSRDGAVFVEPFVESVEEAGVQWEIPPDGGEPDLVGVVPLLSDDRGQYRGSVIPSTADVPGQWQTVIEFSRRAALRAQSLGYFGPLGIDAMRYRDADGELRERPLQDINARWTMGRLALGWRGEIPASGMTVLRAGSENDWAATADMRSQCLRISPHALNSESVRHVFWLETGRERPVSAAEK
ncbi:hypothetical protein Pan44_45620 [Caulifigura coniformis]|uniref:ATP-grasp domain-containing protein n=1 Tax=Caulifigura coniformis TaxID=2527983 RepID=A0A517SK59_9PLAN|nr:hypothetical protein [Caulifigura coniformis]QDT56507.1 hypothetical protein Pan44_45620 [Caulifigura coniformis]